MRLSPKQRAMLERIRERRGVETIMELVRREHRPHGGHSAGYARFHRLRRRNLVLWDNTVGRWILPTSVERAL